MFRTNKFLMMKDVIITLKFLLKDFESIQRQLGWQVNDN